MSHRPAHMGWGPGRSISWPLWGKGERALASSCTVAHRPVLTGLPHECAHVRRGFEGALAVPTRHAKSHTGIAVRGDWAVLRQMSIHQANLCKM